jgi:hypothetical protein
MFQGAKQLPGVGNRTPSAAAQQYRLRATCLSYSSPAHVPYLMGVLCAEFEGAQRKRARALACCSRSSMSAPRTQALTGQPPTFPFEFEDGTLCIRKPFARSATCAKERSKKTRSNEPAFWHPHEFRWPYLTRRAFSRFRASSQRRAYSCRTRPCNYRAFAHRC